MLYRLLSDNDRNINFQYRANILRQSVHDGIDPLLWLLNTNRVNDYFRKFALESKKIRTHASVMVADVRLQTTYLRKNALLYKTLHRGFSARCILRVDTVRFRQTCLYAICICVASHLKHLYTFFLSIFFKTIDLYRF